jgi:hypothetical protein
MSEFRKLFKKFAMPVLLVSTGIYLYEKFVNTNKNKNYISISEALDFHDFETAKKMKDQGFDYTLTDAFKCGDLESIVSMRNNGVNYKNTNEELDVIIHSAIGIYPVENGLKCLKFAITDGLQLRTEDIKSVGIYCINNEDIELLNSIFNSMLDKDKNEVKNYLNMLIQVAIKTKNMNMLQHLFNKLVNLY